MTRREEKRTLTMEEDGYGFAQKESDKGSEESGRLDLQQILQKVDKILAEFYEIHGPDIKDQGHNP
jgi:hypothetical protein